MQLGPFVVRLTDPIPTTETSITPRQRPKAVHTQPAAGILPIQPAALTPRKRANVPCGVAQPVGMYGTLSLFSCLFNENNVHKCVPQNLCAY